MKTIGFLISHKNNEKRRALLPHDLSGIRNPQQLYFEEGYGVSVGYSDEDFGQIRPSHPPTPASGTF